MTRLWVPGYQCHYSINHLGIVWSHKNGKIKEKKTYLSKGYPAFSVYKYPNKPKILKVHRVLAELFLPSWNPMLQVNHIDGNKENNNLNNLELCTSIENIRHAVKNNLRGKVNGNAKLTIEQVIKIRDLKGEYTIKDISRLFKVSKITIDRIINYRSWKNV